MWLKRKKIEYACTDHTYLNRDSFPLPTHYRSMYMCGKCLHWDMHEPNTVRCYHIIKQALALASFSDVANNFLLEVSTAYFVGLLIIALSTI